MRRIKASWGYSFIIGFLILLLTAATLSAINLKTLAEAVANVAFFSLAIGVMLQIIGKNPEGDHAVHG